MTLFVRLFAGTGTLEFLTPGILLAAAVTCLAASLYLLLPKSGRYGKTSRRVGWLYWTHYARTIYCHWAKAGKPWGGSCLLNSFT